MVDQVQIDSVEKQGSDYIVEVDVEGNLATTNDSLLESDLMKGEEVVGEFDAFIRSRPAQMWIVRFFQNLLQFIFHLFWSPIAWTLSILLCCLGPLQCFWIDNYFCLQLYPIFKWSMCLRCLDKKIDSNRQKIFVTNFGRIISWQSRQHGEIKAASYWGCCLHLIFKCFACYNTGSTSYEAQTVTRFYNVDSIKAMSHSYVRNRGIWNRLFGCLPCFPAKGYSSRLRLFLDAFPETGSTPETEDTLFPKENEISTDQDMQGGGESRLVKEIQALLGPMDPVRQALKSIGAMQIFIGVVIVLGLWLVAGDSAPIGLVLIVAALCVLSIKFLTVSFKFLGFQTDAILEIYSVAGDRSNGPDAAFDRVLELQNAILACKAKLSEPVLTGKTPENHIEFERVEKMTNNVYSGVLNKAMIPDDVIAMAPGEDALAAFPVYERTTTKELVIAYLKGAAFGLILGLVCAPTEEAIIALCVILVGPLCSIVAFFLLVQWPKQSKRGIMVFTDRRVVYAAVKSMEGNRSFTGGDLESSVTSYFLDGIREGYIHVQKKEIRAGFMTDNGAIMLSPVATSPERAKNEMKTYLEQLHLLTEPSMSSNAIVTNPEHTISLDTIPPNCRDYIRLMPGEQIMGHVQTFVQRNLWERGDRGLTTLFTCGLFPVTKDVHVIMTTHRCLTIAEIHNNCFIKCMRDYVDTAITWTSHESTSGVEILGNVGVEETRFKKCFPACSQTRASSLQLRVAYLGAYPVEITQENQSSGIGLLEEGKMMHFRGALNEVMAAKSGMQPLFAPSTKFTKTVSTPVPYAVTAQPKEAAAPVGSKYAATAQSKDIEMS